MSTTVAKHSHRYLFSEGFFIIYIYSRFTQIMKPFISDSFILQQKTESGFIINNTILTKSKLIKCSRF